MFAWLRNLFAAPEPELKFTISVEGGDWLRRAAPPEEERDAFDVQPAWLGALKPLELAANIAYTDRTGLRTRRRIITRGYGSPYPNEGTVILAHCELRGANRTFVVSRIDEFIDAETGEVVNAIDSYLDDRYAASPAGRADDAFDRLGDELGILVFGIRAAGSITRPKRAVLSSFIDAAVADPEITELVVELARGTSLSQRGYEAALRRVAGKLAAAARGELMGAIRAGARSPSSKPFAEAAVKSAERLLLKPAAPAKSPDR